MAVCLLLPSSLEIAPIPVCPDSPGRCVLHSVSHNPHASADMYYVHTDYWDLNLARTGKDDEARRTTTAKSTVTSVIAVLGGSICDGISNPNHMIKQAG